MRYGLLLALVSSATSLLAQQPRQGAATQVAQAVDSNALRAHLRFLADDALEGRRPGTRGGELAAKYIAAQFERLGLEPAGDSGTYFQRVPIITLTPDPTIKLTGAAPAELAYRKDYVLWSMRNEPTVQVSGDLVFVGYGIVAPEYQWDDYKGVDVKNKIVVVLVNDPGLRDSTIFRGKILTYYGRWTYKIEEAQRQGAAGILMVHTTESATYPWSTVQSSWTGPQVRIEQPPTSLVIAGWLNGDAAGRIFSQSGQNLDSLSAQAARKGFQAVPLKVGVDATVKSSITRSSTSNVLGRWPGRGPLADEAVLIGGHYDHFGIGVPVNGDSIYNGALDNASGTAAVLTAAEAFARSRVHTGRSIVFIGFTAEESGLLGSQALVARPVIPLKRVAAILNMDVMNLYGRTRDVAALGLDQSSLGPVFSRAAAAEGLKVSSNEEALLRGSYFRSDHFPLAKAGVPGTSIENGRDYVGQAAGFATRMEDEYTAKHYHQPSDEMLPSFKYAGAVQQLRVIVRTAVAVGNAAAQPTWNATSEFRQAGRERRGSDASSRTE
jgi:Zn-dependent M28 family amino/carboxypeptidase